MIQNFKCFKKVLNFIFNSFLVNYVYLLLLNGSKFDLKDVSQKLYTC